MFKLLLTAAAIFFTAVSCSQNPREKFGVEFDCPDEWKITNENIYKNRSAFVSVERNGSESSGILTIVVKNEELDAFDQLISYRDELKSMDAYEDMEFSQPRSGSYGRYEGFTCSYRTSVESIPLQGDIYSFVSNGKTFMLAEQEAIEDHDENMQGFKQLRDSFTVK